MQRPGSDVPRSVPAGCVWHRTEQPPALSEEGDASRLHQLQALLQHRPAHAHQQAPRLPQRPHHVEQEVPAEVQTVTRF